MAASYNFSQSKTAVLRLGYRVRSSGELGQDVAAFQASYNLGRWLTIDGSVGPLTSAALAKSLAMGGKISPNFRMNEFDCTCGGRFPGCRRNLIRREELRALEVYRKRLNHAMTPVSGYRCPGRNAEVGSKPGSQHPIGTACDLSGELTWQQVKALGVFSGIGYKRSTGKVLHADVRHIFPRTNNGGSLRNPMIWIYS